MFFIVLLIVYLIGGGAAVQAVLLPLIGLQLIAGVSSLGGGRR